jgi:hypothetical protein
MVVVTGRVAPACSAGAIPKAKKPARISAACPRRPPALYLPFNPFRPSGQAVFEASGYLLYTSIFKFADRIRQTGESFCKAFIQKYLP